VTRPAVPRITPNTLLAGKRFLLFSHLTVTHLIPSMIQDLRLQVRDLSVPIAQNLGISKIPDFADVIVLSSLFFSVVHNNLSPAVSGALFPVSYGKAGKRVRNNW
jgi:hypothetical protein